MATVSAPLPSPPQTQALNSTTFRLPPLDGSLTLPELYDWHGENTKKHPLFEYVDSSVSGESILKVIYWDEVRTAIHRVARLVHERTGYTAGGTHPPVLAIVAAPDTITYFTTIVGVMRAGVIVFPISPRNSPAAVAHLVVKTSVTHIFVGREQGLKDLVKASLDLLDATSALGSAALSEMPVFEDIYLPGNKEEPEFYRMPFKKPDINDTGIILHSSGSTAFPKPIMLTHLSIAQMSLIPFFGERDLTGQRVSLHSVPMYHGLGVIQMMFAVSCGPIMTTFRPQSPAMVPTPDTVFKYAMATNSDIVYCVPSFVEIWSGNNVYVERLSKIQGILFGGGPLSKEVGDFLTSKGVTIFNLYGCTECGIMSPILPRKVDDWEYFKISPHIKPHFLYDDTGNAELVMITTDIHQPAVINTKVDGVDAYATSDLLAPHPTKPGHWKVFGRADDQIVHNTGEKTNPGPLEKILCQDPHISAAVMFGRGRFQAGVMVAPKPQYIFDPADEEKLARFRNLIWPTVELMNSFAPQHSRLFKEMIMVVIPEKPLTFTAKNTVRRQAVLDDYDSEIDALYFAVSETAQEGLAPPQDWSNGSTLIFLRVIVKRVMKKSIADDEDFFEHGCDSLQATWIRNTTLHALRVGPKINTRKISSNFVYQHPTLNTLSSFVSSVVLGTEVSINHHAKIDEMRSLVTKYSKSFVDHTGSEAFPTSHVILLTGSTGALGCSVLAHLANDSNVTRIYALNRKANDKEPLKERQSAALKDRGYDSRILDDKITLLEGNLAHEEFALPSNVYSKLRESVTHIIHNAWPVNFNISLSAFEPNIKGVRHLVDFSLSSPFSTPPPIVYTSSAGVFKNILPNIRLPIEEAPIDPQVAIGQGYTESKWVSEKLLEAAREEKKLNTVIVRVGQISGGLNGSWNTAEWLPSMVRSGIELKCLPMLNDEISWIPLDSAGKAVVELRHSKSPFVHLVHPRPTKWSAIFKTLQKELDVALVPYADWLASLEQSAEQRMSASEMELLRYNPALRILDFFRAIPTVSQPGHEAMNMPVLSILEATKSCRELDSIKSIDDEDVMRWLKYWKEIGFLAA